MDSGRCAVFSIAARSTCAHVFLARFCFHVSQTGPSCRDGVPSSFVHTDRSSFSFISTSIIVSDARTGHIWPLFSRTLADAWHTHSGMCSIQVGSPPRAACTLLARSTIRGYLLALLQSCPQPRPLPRGSKHPQTSILTWGFRGGQGVTCRRIL